MSKNIKIIICFILMICLFHTLYATGLGTDVSMPTNPADGGINTMTSAETAIAKVWGSVKLILQVVALATILGCGVRYMFASADQKADIKKSLGILVIGAAIVFGTTLIIDFITDIAGQVMVVR